MTTPLSSSLPPPPPISTPDAIAELKAKMQALKDEFATLLIPGTNVDRAFLLYTHHQALEGTLITLREWQFAKAAKELHNAPSPNHVARMLRHVAHRLIGQLYPELNDEEVDTLLDTLADPYTDAYATSDLVL